MHGLQVDSIISILLMALVVERVTEIVVDSKIAEPIRSALFKWSLIDPTKPIKRSAYFKEYVAYFIKCGYCFSVWVGAAAALVLPISFFDNLQYSGVVAVILKWGLSALTYHGLANWIHVFFKRSQVGIVDVKDLKVTLEDNRDSK